MVEPVQVGLEEVEPEVPGAPDEVETGVLGETPFWRHLMVKSQQPMVEDPRTLLETAAALSASVGQQCCGCRRFGRGFPPRWLARGLCQRWRHVGWSEESVRLSPGS